MARPWQRCACPCWRARLPHCTTLNVPALFYLPAICLFAGHSYLAYGPLLNRATQVVFEGVPTHPTPGRGWEVVDKYQVGGG